MNIYRTNETPYLYPFKSRPFAPWHERSKNIFIETFKKETKNILQSTRGIKQLMKFQSFYQYSNIILIRNILSNSNIYNKFFSFAVFF